MMMLRSIRAGGLVVSLVLGSSGVALAQAGAMGCGFVPQQQTPSADTLIRQEASRHLLAIFPQARNVTIELGLMRAGEASVRVRFTLPGAGSRVRTMDLERSFDGRWAVTSMRRMRVASR